MKVEEPDQQVPAFNMEQAEAEVASAQSNGMAEQQAFLESIQDEAYVEANWAFLLLGNAVISKKILRTRKIHLGDA